MPAHLTRAVIEIEQHAAAQGWDAPPRLYALADTAALVREQPHLAAQLGTGTLTPIEQDPLPADAPLDDVLARISWPAEVTGCAVVVERLMLPPAAEAALAEREAGQGDGSGLATWVAEHPDRQEVRIVVGVLRGGERECAVRLRAHDRDDAVLSGPALVPGLAAALAATLEP